MIPTKCPSCGAGMRVDDRFLGKRGKCSRCGAGFTVARVDDNPPSAPPPPPAAAANPFAGDFALPAAPEPSSGMGFGMPFLATPKPAIAAPPPIAPPPIAPSASPPVAAPPAKPPSHNPFADPFGPAASPPPPAAAPPVAPLASPPVAAPPAKPPSHNPFADPFGPAAALPSANPPVVSPFDEPTAVNLAPPPAAAMFPFGGAPPLAPVRNPAPAEEPAFAPEPPLAALAAAPPLPPAPVSPPPRVLPMEQKIARVETFVAKLPVQATWLSSAGIALRAGKTTTRIFVRLVAESGLEGWGEAAPHPLLNGESIEAAAALLRRSVPAALHGATVGDVEGVIRRLDKLHPGASVAKAAVEAAAWDLAARALEAPLWALWGGKRGARVTLAATLQAEGAEPIAEQVAKAQAAGFRAFQVRLIGSRFAKDRVALEAAAKALPPGAAWSFVVDGGYPLDAAVRALRLAAKFGAASARPPTPHPVPSLVARLARAADLPLAVEDPLRRPADLLEFVRADAGEIAVLRPGLTGPRIALEMAALAAAAGWRRSVALHAETELGLAFAAHLCLAAGIDLPIEGSGRQFVEAPFLGAPRPLRDGNWALPEGPGTGLTIDEAALRAAAE